MSDPRNVAHAKKVTQEKKHRGTGRGPDETTVQPDKKPATANESHTASPPAALEGSLTVLGKLKEMEFHSRANLERLAELALTVEDELKQKDILGPLGEVQSAQNTFQTKLTALLETYQAECDRMQGPAA